MFAQKPHTFSITLCITTLLYKGAEFCGTFLMSERVLFVEPVPALCPQNRGLITCCFVCGQTWLNFRTASDFFWSRALCNLISYRFLTTSACQPRFQLCAFASQPKMGGFKEEKKERKTTNPLFESPLWVTRCNYGQMIVIFYPAT